VRETTIRQNIVVDLATYNSSGSFSLEIKPSLADTLSVTSSTADTVDTGTFSYQAEWLNLASVASQPDSLEATHTSTGIQSKQVPVSNVAGVLGIPLTTTTAVGVWAVNITALATEAAQVSFVIFSTTASAKSTLSTITLSLGENPMSTSVSISVPNNTVGLGITAVNNTFQYGIGVTVGYSLQYTSGAGMGFGNAAVTQTTFGLPIASAIADMQAWRVVAQDVLVTFQGDTLNDGGNIAAARVASSWISQLANPYNDIIALPYDRYDGPLKHGAHVHWIPGSIDDLSPVRTVAQENQYGSNKMVIAGTITHPSSSVRVRVCTAIAYYSTNPSYGMMDWAPPPTDLGLVLQYIARVVPAATSNDSHILQKLPGLVRKHARMGVKYLVENPEMLAKLTAMFLSSL
jgi:hypothetical protein